MFLNGYLVEHVSQVIFRVHPRCHSIAEENEVLYEGKNVNIYQKKKKPQL